MAESLCCLTEIVTTLFDNWLYPQYKIKVKKNKRLINSRVIKKNKLDWIMRFA